MCLSLIINILLLNTKLSFAIVCTSFSGTNSGSYIVKTNVTGSGNACCPTSAYAGNFYGVTYQPYDANNQVCCKGTTQFVGNTQYQYSTVSSGNMCCNGVGYWNSSGICCSYRDVKYGSQVGVGNGDTCCGSKPYFKSKQACCESSIIGMTIYTVADGCCYGNTRGYNKSFQVCCNTWNIGNGNACCNENAEINPNAPYDVPYYTSEKCCRNGILFDRPCLNKSVSSKKLNFLLFHLCIPNIFILLKLIFEAAFNLY